MGNKFFIKNKSFI